MLYIYIHIHIYKYIYIYTYIYIFVDTSWDGPWSSGLVPEAFIFQDLGFETKHSHDCILGGVSHRKMICI